MADYYETPQPDPKSGDILQLLEGLQYGDVGSPKQNMRSYSRKPNENIGADPRAKAIQQYMEMQGAGSIPQLPFKMPDAKGRLGKPSIKQRDEMLNDLDDRETDPHSGIEDTNPLFRDDYTPKRDTSDPGLAATQGDAPFDEEDERRRSQMHLPTYMDRQGRPSPNKDDDEGFLKDISKTIDGEQFDPEELKQAQRELYNSQTDSAMSKFIRKYGKNNMPDFTGDEYDESPQGVEKNRMRGEMANPNELRGMPFDDLRRLYLFQKKQRGESLTDEELLQMIEPQMEPEPRTQEPQSGMNPLPYRPPVRGQETMPSRPPPEFDDLNSHLQQRRYSPKRNNQEDI